MEKDNKYEIFGSIFLLASRLEGLKSFKIFMEPLTIKQWFLLVCVNKFFDKPSISEMASFMGNSQQNIKVIASKMHEKGFISLEKDANDKRVTRIILTQKSYEYMQEKDKISEVKISQLFEGFSYEEMKDFLNYLNKLIKNAERMELQHVNNSDL